MTNRLMKSTHDALEFIKSGMTVAEASKKTGSSPNTIYRQMRAHGLQPNSTRGRPEKEDSHRNRISKLERQVEELTARMTVLSQSMSAIESNLFSANSDAHDPEC